MDDYDHLIYGGSCGMMSTLYFKSLSVTDGLLLGLVIATIIHLLWAMARWQWWRYRIRAVARRAAARVEHAE